MLMHYEQPPDGGWGWVVAFTTFLAYAIGWGVPRGFSVLFENFQENFNSTNSETSWIISLIGGFLLIGTLPGSLINSAFGARVTMMIGGYLSCIGMVIVSQSTTISEAYVGSTIAGLGFGFGYCSGSSHIGVYFDKKRSLAYGIASMGAPASSILLPLLLVYLTNIYAWRGAVLVVAGIALHLAVAGALLRPVSVTNETQYCADFDNHLHIEIPLKEFETDTLDISTQNIILEGSIQNVKPQIIQMQYPEFDRMSFVSALSQSNQHLDSKKKKSFSNSLPLLPRSAHNSPKTLRSSAGTIKISPFHTLLPEQKAFAKEKQSSPVEHSKALKQLQHNDYSSSRIITSLVISNSISSLEQLAVKKKESGFNRFNAYIKPYLSLLKQWRFMIFCLVGLLDFGVRLTPASFIVVHARTQGLNKDLGALLLVIFAIFDLCIRPISGFFTNKIPQKYLKRGIEIFLFGCAQFIMFLLNIVAPHAANLSSLSMYMAVYGVANGLNSSWCFPVLSRLVPVKHLRHAIGIFHFFCGIGFLTGPPLAGFFADMTGHYYAVFYFTSIAMFFSGSLAWILYFLTRKFGIRKLKMTLQTKETVKTSRNIS